MRTSPTLAAWIYLKSSLLLLWSIPVALLKAYDVLARIQRSKGEAWPQVPTWGSEALFFVALLVAPIVAYVRRTRQITGRLWREPVPEHEETSWA